VLARIQPEFGANDRLSVHDDLGPLGARLQHEFAYERSSIGDHLLYFFALGFSQRLSRVAQCFAQLTRSEGVLLQLEIAITESAQRPSGGQKRVRSRKRLPRAREVPRLEQSRRFIEERSGTTLSGKRIRERE
jgi:hypothetical protein